jgi:hypothetical protein
MRWRLFSRSTARRAREMELSSFRAELDAAAAAAPALQNGLLDRLRARADGLGLTEDDGGIELEMLDGLRELALLAGAVDRGGLPLVDNQHRVIAGEACRFSAPATRITETADNESGRLFLTDQRVVFLGSSVNAAPWAAFTTVTRGGRDLVLAGATRRHQFRLNTFADALRAAWLAGRLR